MNSIRSIVPVLLWFSRALKLIDFLGIRFELYVLLHFSLCPGFHSTVSLQAIGYQREKTERNKWKNAWWKLYYAMLNEECFECISCFVCTLFMSNKLKVGYVCFDPVIYFVNVFLIAFWHLSAYQHSQRPVMQDWYQIDVSISFYRVYSRKMTFLKKQWFLFLCALLGLRLGLWCNISSSVHYHKHKMTFIFFKLKKLYKPLNLTNFWVIKNIWLKKYLKNIELKIQNKSTVQAPMIFWFILLKP